jgi:hypothetical protein
MDSTPSSKDTNWQTWLKEKIRKPVVYKKLTLLTETNTILGWKSRKKIYQANGPPKQAGVAITISDRVDFKPNYSEETRKITSF